MKPAKHGFILIVLFTAIQSCSTAHVVTKYDCNSPANDPTKMKTVWTYAWGLVQPKDIDPKCEEKFNHLNRVTVKNNFGFALITVASLGIVMPQRVEWCCTPPKIAPVPIGTPTPGQ